MDSFRKFPLERKWSIWEMWNTKDTINYEKNMQKVGEFSDLWTFWQHWANLPHSDPKFFFTDSSKNEEKIPTGLNCPIEAIGVFQDGIVPAWEDKANKPGCDFYCRLSADQDMKSLWQKTVFTLIGETFPFPELVNGVRILDRGKLFKIEVWVSYYDHPEKTIQMKDTLSRLFEIQRQDMVEIAAHEEKFTRIKN
ncbi:hypothetical protein SteCoe_1604 [Stentor coeruleus]|uniref:Uncharacterized protein n=1 Tax=Stentor coeruleus TaxID=5963 RepID=A0A1R2D1C2_9CILI|nr:hypothetical protein SteCoe_1604 [Stentor coeruleus]